MAQISKTTTNTTTTLNFTLDQLKGQLTPQTPIILKRTRLRNIATFRCNCGQELKISKENIRRAGAWKSSTGHLRSPVYESVMEHYNRAQDLNNLALQLSKHKIDLLQYFQKLERLKKKWQLRAETIERLSAGNTDIEKECWNCHKVHMFRLKIESPIDPEEPLDSITVFRKVGIQDTETNRRLLAHKLHDDEVHGAPYGDFSTYIAYLISLDETVSWIQRLIEHVKAELQTEFEPPSDHGERLLEELYNSLDEMCQIACKEVDGNIKRELNSLENLCATAAFHQT